MLHRTARSAGMSAYEDQAYSVSPKAGFTSGQECICREDIFSGAAQVVLHQNIDTLGHFLFVNVFHAPKIVDLRWVSPETDPRRRPLRCKVWPAPDVTPFTRLRRIVCGRRLHCVIDEQSAESATFHLCNNGCIGALERRRYDTPTIDEDKRAAPGRRFFRRFLRNPIYRARFGDKSVTRSGCDL